MRGMDGGDTGTSNLLSDARHEILQGLLPSFRNASVASGDSNARVLNCYDHGAPIS
jgi:hypothetical protein